MTSSRSSSCPSCLRGESSPSSSVPSVPSAVKSSPVFNPAFVRQAVADLGSIPELARVLGVSKQAVTLWLDGRCVPSLAHINRIAAEVSLDPAAAWLPEIAETDADRAALADRVVAQFYSGHLPLRTIAAVTGLPLGTLSEIKNGKRQLRADQRATLSRFATDLLPSGGVLQSSSWAAKERARRTCRRCAQMNLSEDVLKFFGLADDPWRLDIRVDSDVFLTRDFGRMQKTISRAVERRDFAVVSGPTGAGKSQMARRVLGEISKRKNVRLVRVMAPDIKLISSSSLCDALVKTLAPGTTSHVRTEKLAIQVVEILREHRRQGNTPVIVIDDAHRCRINTLSQLKRFWEFRSPESYEPLLGIVLLGWPELPLTMLNNPELLEVARRADFVELVGLCDSKGRNDEHDEYLKKKLARVGAKRTIFDAAAVKAFAQVPQAQWPLPTNRIASRAMRLAFDLAKTRPEKQRGLVLADDVRQAAQEVV